MVGLAATAPGAAQEVSDWIDAEAANALAGEMREVGIRLFDLECREDEAAEEERTLFRMHWEPNATNVNWSWREANSLAVDGFKREFRAQGFEVKMEHEFIRSRSGEPRTCALWWR